MSEDQKYNIEIAKREHAVLRKYALIQRAGEETVSCQKVYVDITGGLHEALVLDELIHYTLPRSDSGRSGLRVRKEGVLWMAVSRTEWWDRKRLTPKEADGAIERLVKANLIYKDLFLFNKQKTTHIRLNVPEFFRRYAEELDKQNPPEDEGDTIQHDINDLYAMMGMPNDIGIPNGNTPEGILKGNTGILKREEVSPKGDSINNPNTTQTQPNISTPAKKKVPDNYSDEWKILAGEEITGRRDENEAKMMDAANLICMGMRGVDYDIAYGVAYTFMRTRGIVIPESKIKSQRKPLNEMLEMHVLPDHVLKATKKLMDAGMTVTDLYSITRTAIDLANQPVKPVRDIELDDSGAPITY